MFDLIKQETRNDYLAWSNGSMSREDMNERLQARRDLVLMMV